MIRHINKALVLVLIAFTSSCAVLAPETDRELGALLDLLPGVYVGTAPVPGATDGSTQTIYHKIAEIDASQFGGRSFYYQLSTGGPGGPPLQQKIFAFKTNPMRSGNYMRAWILSPGQEEPNLEQRPERWFYLEPSEFMSFPDKCAFRWERAGKGFEGVVSSDKCAFESKGFGQKIRPDMRYAVFADRFEWEETLRNTDGDVLVSTGGNLIAERQSGSL